MDGLKTKTEPKKHSPTRPKKAQRYATNYQFSGPTTIWEQKSSGATDSAVPESIIKVFIIHVVGILHEAAIHDIIGCLCLEK